MYICSVYVYIMVCMCGEHFLSGGVDLWGPAHESALIDENPPLEGLLASFSVPLQVSRRGLCLETCKGTEKLTPSRSALWRVGLTLCITVVYSTSYYAIAQ